MSSLDEKIATWTAEYRQALPLEIKEDATRRLKEADSIIRELKAERDAKQAQIDSLMFEFCPHEMTPEQLAEFEASAELIFERANAELDVMYPSKKEKP